MPSVPRLCPLSSTPRHLGGTKTMRGRLIGRGSVLTSAVMPTGFQWTRTYRFSYNKINTYNCHFREVCRFGRTANKCNQLYIFRFWSVCIIIKFKSTVAKIYSYPVYLSLFELGRKWNYLAQWHLQISETLRGQFKSSVNSVPHSKYFAHRRVNGSELFSRSSI